MTGVKQSGTQVGTFSYDGDGKRVKGVVNGVTTTYVGGLFEWTGSTSTMKKYYNAGGANVAMRSGNGTGTTGLTWLASDHLGSSSVAVNAATMAVTSQMRYKPWGETRYTSGAMPTSVQYTGQHAEVDLGIYFYNARWYDPYITQMTQPDSIIPDPYNPLDWNRYAYVRYNPLKFNDPSGHEPKVGNPCYEPDDAGCRQDKLYSWMFKGSGENGEWIDSDWSYYYSHRDQLWNDPSSWINPDSATGLDLFALHVERLSSHYDESQKSQFVRDFASVFGGIPSEKNWVQAAIEVRNGPHSLPILNEGNQGLDPEYIDTLDPSSNQSHHYAGIFFLSYYTGANPAAAVNFARDPDNPGDLSLGNRAAFDAYNYRFYSDSLFALPHIILGLAHR